MARRRQISEDGGINLDSLMDALTNVVAVLILVLVLVQVDVTQKVEAFLENLLPATAEEVAESKRALAKLEEDLQNKKKLLEQAPPTPEVMEAEKRRLALLEESVEKNKVILAKIDKLRELEKKLRKERDGEQARTTGIQEEIAKLEAQLDATPVLEAPPPEVVTIPKSRPIPPNAEIYYALVFGGRVHLIDPFTPLDLFTKEFQRRKREWRISRITRKGRDRYIYDQRKIAAHFKEFDFRNPRGQAVTVPVRPTDTRLYIHITPDAGKGGTSTGELAKSGNRFAKAMASLRHERQAVLLFWVRPDSFNTYLLARKQADAAGVPAGWEVRWNTNYPIRIADVEVRRLKEPPPPPKDAKPKPPQPPRIGPKLD